MSSKRGMMDQFWDIKNSHPETVLFFRMGDFYELFHEDAVIGSQALGLTLTSRDKKASEPIQMAGFPWHALEDHLKTMLNAGHKVTVCEQEDELRPGAKLLERVVTRVYTPGSLYEESLIGLDNSAVLAAISIGKDAIGVAIIDASTGQAHSSQYSGRNSWQSIYEEMIRSQPSELVFTTKDSEDENLHQLARKLDKIVLSQHDVSKKRSQKTLKQMLDVSDLGHLDLDSAPQAITAVSLAADYLAKMHRIEEIPLRTVQILSEGEWMVIDQTTLRNLELLQTLAGEKEGSLLGSIDRCRTAMGRRTLKRWLLQPLLDIDAISRRHESVSVLSRSSKRLSNLRNLLLGLRDMERLATQLAYDRSGSRELVAIANALERMPAIKTLCQESSDPLMMSYSDNITALDLLRADIESILNDEQPLNLRDGGLIRQGVDSVLDDLREKAAIGHNWFKELEIKERANLEIPSLKVRHNRQIGWYIEVTKTHLSKVPEEWQRKQEMTNGNRYVTDELREWADLLLTADTKANNMEFEMFKALRSRCKNHAEMLAEISSNVAAIDVLQCFADVARSRSWTRPEMFEDTRFEAKATRHPVLELEANYVPNDIKFDKKRSFLLITGPNMGGKSTYLRCAALTAILAQAGSFTPTNKAKIGLVDRVFTRVGASDDIRRGRSTFMVEMMEVAHILRSATSRSLILLDEVGRGTSTFDGLSIAWSVTEDICNRLQARTLFATHYHQLIGLEGEVAGLVNLSVQVATNEGELRFLHTVAEGPCDDSYGIQVASLAGLPRPIIERAGDLLTFLEGKAAGAKAGERGTPQARTSGQSSIMGFMGNGTVKEDKVAQSIKQAVIDLDLDSLSPRQAQDALYRLHKILEE